MSKNFIQRCVEGKISTDKIDDYIDQWHSSDGGVSLHEFLGMSWDEYATWVEKPESLSFIILARKNGITLTEALAQQAVSDKKSLETTQTLMKWLKQKNRRDAKPETARRHLKVS